jgi:hypothetical protein
MPLSRIDGMARPRIVSVPKNVTVSSTSDYLRFPAAIKKPLKIASSYGDCFWYKKILLFSRAGLTLATHSIRSEKFKGNIILWYLS